MSVAPDRYLSFEEYLAFEAESQVRHEFVEGVVYAMAGATKRHNQVAGAFYRALADAALQMGCNAYISDVKLRVGSNAYYPDVMVVCEPGEHDLYETAPCLVVEVISPATERADRREKRAAYVSIPTLQAYLIVDPSWPRVEHHERINGQWQVTVLGPGDSVDLTCPPVTLRLDDLYPDDWRS